MKLSVTVNGIAYSVEVEVEEEKRQIAPIYFGGGSGATHSEPANASVSGVSANAVVAPLAGSVFKILVEEGEEIEAGQVLLILEAMKMETEITAPNAGTITSVRVAVGDSVQGGQALITID
ncbi:biotin/lipoyl-binding protein [Corynebacterium pseudotuberculosis]|uniref:biotin carboxylase n=1 Tax=Corynebacterium pseudotuberculosis 258 TaxID=1168865 RepID=A0AAU8PP80_CORPS|nr:biotin/lipoyl-containing protein [Corynebacterium pseudotuberculosis]AER68644.1 Methylmalonyl-CoA carboxyltransferase 1.3S subunit [Corynebacterium pseudotuberculosis 1/06-A]AEQ06129.1 biotin/lipoyl-binding protein [Corynebacterium pseudotuberculosis CIP 52.97]AFB71905.1 biotin/lipoyl-binding protein [Corynebacterium pseudotuberculosis 316]AFK16216.1 biotin/lipoyl-binding protein [Corynebacterium pseudotuberculosis 258]AKS12917.1 Methylmalonyl-CoA carboxyltransferase 1.3S [Corynebacterium p